MKALDLAEARDLFLLLNWSLSFDLPLNRVFLHLLCIAAELLGLLLQLLSLVQAL